MNVGWIIVGALVLGAGLADLFLSSLNYDESGFLATPLCALQWRVLRRFTRRLPRRWRPAALRQATGLQIVLSLATWLVFIVIGFGLIYYGSMARGDFQYQGRGVHGGLFDALYLSAAQLATVGTSQVTPATDVLRLLSILETLSGVVLVTLALTFLLGVYQVVRDLSSLCAKLFNVERLGGDALAGTPVAGLAPYFPQARPTGLDAHLQSLHDSFSSYLDGLRLHHVAYYFQSGRDHFSLPYALDMLGGLICALRWGLPGDHPAAQEPALAVLAFRFDRFDRYLHAQLRWKSTDVPELLPYETFAPAYLRRGGSDDPWLGRFVRMDEAIGGLAGISEREDPLKAYERYRQWLPFAFRVQQLVGAVSRDLDYQPVLGSENLAPDGTARAAPGQAAGPSLRGAVSTLRAQVLRWIAVPDPGLTRLMTAARALLAAAAGAGTAYLVPGLPG